MSRATRWPLWAVAAILFVGVGLAAADEAPNEADRTALRERATAMWDTKVKQDADAEYGFLDPRVRPNVPQGRWTQLRGTLRVLKYDIEDVTTQGAEGEVKVKFTFRVNLAVAAQRPELRVPRERTVTERWVKVDGTWYKMRRAGSSLELPPAAAAPSGGPAAPPKPPSP